MKKSPKTVKIDLLSESQKRNKSPSPPTRKTSRLKHTAHQFSFSHQDSPFLQSKSKLQQQRQVSRNLFGRSPDKPKSKAKSPPKKRSNDKNAKQFVPKQYYSDKSERLYKNKIAEEEFLKKPLDKIKHQFFNSIRNNKLQTIRALKEIGKYAEKRSKEKRYPEQNEKENEQKPRKPIPVQFYGFDPEDRRPYSPHPQKKVQTYEQIDVSSRNQRAKTRVQTAEKGTYFNFQQQLNKHLAATGPHFASISLDSPTVRHSYPTQPIEQTSSVQSSSVQSINQIEIDAVCEIFEMCEKYDQGARIVISEFFMLLQQFQRLYFIKVIQQSEANGLTREKIRINESDFYDLLKRFEQNFKIVFYRRQACDIYDCLYYLKESHRLDKVCSLFLGLKKILNL